LTPELEGSVLVDNLTNPRVHHGVAELHHTATRDTDEVIVMVILAEHGVEPRLPVAELPRLGESVFDQQLKRAINGRVPDAWRRSTHGVEQLVYADVFVDLEKRLDDAVPLPSRLQTAFAEPLVKPLENLLYVEVA
jgi:hypothetical protein